MLWRQPPVEHGPCTLTEEVYRLDREAQLAFDKFERRAACVRTVDRWARDEILQALPEYIAFMEKQLQWHGVLDLCEAQQEEADTHQRHETEPSSEARLPDAVDVTAAVSTPEDGDASADQIAQQEQDAQKVYVAGWFDRLLCASRVRTVPTPPRRLAAESWARLTAPVGS